MQKFIILTVLLISLAACGQRIAPKGPADKIIDTNAY